MLENFVGNKCSICNEIYEEGQEIPKLCQRDGTMIGPIIKKGFVHGVSFEDKKIYKSYFVILGTFVRDGEEHFHEYKRMGFHEKKTPWNPDSNGGSDDMTRIDGLIGSFGTKIRLLNNKEFLEISQIILEKGKDILKDHDIEKLYSHHTILNNYITSLIK